MKQKSVSYFYLFTIMFFTLGFFNIHDVYYNRSGIAIGLDISAQDLVYSMPDKYHIRNSFKKIK